MNLYEMTSGYNEIFEMAVDSDMDLDMLEDTLQSIEGAIEEKVENGIKLLKSLEYQVDSTKNEIDRLQQRQKALKGRIEKIKAWYKTNMEIMGKKKISTAVGTMGVYLNPPKLIIDEKQVTIDYVREIPAEYVPDKDRIRDALKQGEKIPWAQLVQETSLRIR